MTLPLRFLSLCLVAGLSFTGMAVAAGALPSTGLGQAWPNAADVSTSPRYHVYLFERLGVRYVQVNDGSGGVRGAFAYTASDILGLPIGMDAVRLATPSEPLSGAFTAPGEIVYVDDRIKVYIASQPDGTARLLATPGDCDNPAECSVRGP